MSVAASLALRNVMSRLLNLAAFAAIVVSAGTVSGQQPDLQEETTATFDQPLSGTSLSVTPKRRALPIQCWTHCCVGSTNRKQNCRNFGSFSSPAPVVLRLQVILSLPKRSQTRSRCSIQRIASGCMQVWIL